MQEDFVMITSSEAEHAYTKSRTHFFILFYFILYIYIYMYLLLYDFLGAPGVCLTVSCV